MSRLTRELEEVRRVRHKALCVGVGAYRSIRRLANPVRDATSMNAALSGIGYASTSVFDCSLSELRAAAAAFVDTVNAGDMVVVFLAGHGSQSDSRNYFVTKEFPSGAKLNDTTAFQLQVRLLCRLTLGTF